MKNSMILGAMMAVTSFGALAHDFKVGDLMIDHPYSFTTPPTATGGAGYMTVTNNGSEADRLVSAKADFAHTMLHESKMVDGVMKMEHQMGGVEIPAGETVSFEPGGLHVMFMKLEDPLTEGQALPVTLTFEKAGEITVEFEVDKRKSGGHDHSGHGTN